MRLKDTVMMVKNHVNNYFNNSNDPELLSVTSPQYKVFLELCEEIHEFNEKEKESSGNITSETVIGVHTWAKATGANGLPPDWTVKFASRLNSYRKMRR
jgi:hypothetical protein